MSLDLQQQSDVSLSTSKSTTPEQCPVCDSVNYRFLFMKKYRKFWRCRDCGSECIWPLPTKEELEAYYEKSYQAGMYQAFAGATKMKRLTAVARYQQIAKHCRAGRWLDVGCSTGTFVEEAKRHDIDCQGVELSLTAVEQARSRGLEVTCSTLSDFSADAQFDTITAFDVLEHVPNPVQFLKEIHRRLVPGGTVVITVPNLHSLSRMLMRRRWYFYIPEEHLNYFTPASLRKLFVKTGFHTVRARRTYKPLTFDYSLLQFEEYNPWIFRSLNLLGKVLPTSLRQKAFPLYIGEIMLVARKEPSITNGK